MLSSHGQPARASSQVAARNGAMSGSRMSTWTQLEAKAFRPPSDGGLLLLINRKRPYFFSTPQKTVTGGGGLRNVTLARTAVTLYHSPSGMWVTTCVLSTCASVAIRFFSAGSEERR